MVYYRIRSKVTIDDQPAYLSVSNDDNKKVVIKQYLIDSDSQVWSLAGLVDDGNNLKGFAIVNKQTEQAISAPTDKAAVTMIPFIADVSGRVTWNIAGMAIQLRDNTSMNLNVLGGSPYDNGRTVGVWTWDEGGTANELWTWEIAYDR